MQSQDCSPTIDTTQMSLNDVTAGGSINSIIQRNISKNIRSLVSFLDSSQFITEKNNQKTNIINVEEKRTWFIPPTHQDTFFNLLELCRRESRMLHYSERQETADVGKTGIMIDFDRYQTQSDAQINSKHYELLARCITKLLGEFIDLCKYTPDESFTFKIIFIRKPAVLPTANGMYKDGFHILIPEIQISRGLKKHLLAEIAKRGVIASVFRNIDHADDPNKMLDMMSASAPVHFFGNSKPGCPAYKLDFICELSIYPDGSIDKTIIDIDKVNEMGLNLTQELALGFAGKSTWLKKQQMDYLVSLETKIQLLVEKTHKDILSCDEILTAENSVDILTMGDADAYHLKRLLEILDISYATEYEKWFKVICAIAHTSPNYKNLAIWFSHRKPESWSQTEIDRVWAEALRNHNAPVTMRSIIHWARESSPQRFREVEKENYFQILARGAYDNEGRVEQALAAKVCYAMIGDKFIADAVETGIGKNSYCWYEFVVPGQAMKHGEIYKWRKELGQPDNIHLFLADHLSKVYTQLNNNIKDRKENAANTAEAKYWTKVGNNFRSYMTKLNNDGFQNGVIKQAQYRFRQRGFIEELDSYECVIGVGNGVLEVGASPRLIKGFHEYKISKYTDTDYIPFDENNPCVKVLLRAFRDIFPEEDVFEYMLYHAATGLDARESSCILTLLVGGGQNGKSFFAKMIHNTLGNMYCASGKSALLTSRVERAESANSAQMQMKDKRYFYFDEFNKCEVLNTGRVKAIVNPGWQSGRDLNQRQTNFKNTCNPICLSNFDFIIDTTDHGTWRRIYYYINKVKFCRNPTPGSPYERKVDPRFIDEYACDPAYKQAMLSIMVHYYEKLCKQWGGDIKNVPVPTIERETWEFRNRQDALNRFITQMIVKSPNAEPVSLTTLSKVYAEWYNANIKEGKHNMMDIQAQFENSCIAPSLERRFSVMFLTGHRIKTLPEEPLLSGETALNTREQVISPPQLQPRQPPQPVPIEDKKLDPDIQELIDDAPLYIQDSIGGDITPNPDHMYLAAEDYADNISDDISEYLGL